jgi:hypothetical protein
VDLCRELDFYAFNVMAHTTFSISYEGARKHEALHTLASLHRAQSALGVASQVPWAYTIALGFPKWLTGFTAPAEFSTAAFRMLQERLEVS